MSTEYMVRCWLGRGEKVKKLVFEIFINTNEFIFISIYFLLVFTYHPHMFQNHANENLETDASLRPLLGILAAPDIDCLLYNVMSVA